MDSGKRREPDHSVPRVHVELELPAGEPERVSGWSNGQPLSARARAVRTKRLYQETEVGYLRD